MKCNMGSTDRILRAVIGIAIISWGLATKSWLGALGLIPLGTAAVRWCPAYVPFRIRTDRTRK